MGFYRGYGECKASRWVSAAADLHTLMRKVSRVGGETQIECALNPRTCRDRKGQGQALVFVDDAMEERADWLCHKAGELGRGGTPLFVPQEGIIPIATQTGPAVRCAQTCRSASPAWPVSRPSSAGSGLCCGWHAAPEDYAHRHSDKAALEGTRQLSPSPEERS